MDKIELLSNAKLNIHLDILNKRDDGFHNLYMINQSITIYDFLSVKKNIEKKISFEVNEKSIDNKNNIIFKVINLFEKTIKRNIFVDIKLVKNIPMEAGLGGGSSNGAAMLLALKKLYDIDIDNVKLESIAIEIGADVPFCLEGGTSIVSGIGQNIKKISSEKFWYIIIIPNFSISTQKAYKEYDKFIKEDYNQMKDKIVENVDIFNLNGRFIQSFCFNSFELLYNDIYGLDTYKKDLVNSGAFYSQMSGSGSAIYGIYNSPYSRDEAFISLSKKYNNIYKCETAEKGIVIVESD